MHLDRLDDGHDLQETAQTTATKLRHDEPFLHALVDLLDIRIPCVGHLDELAAHLLEIRQHVFADRRHRTAAPVVAVHDEIGLQRCDDLIVHDGVLYDDALDLRLCFQKRDALFERYGGEAVVTNHFAIGEDSRDDRSALLGFAQDIPMPLVNRIGAEARVSNLFFHIILFPSSFSAVFPALPRYRSPVHLPPYTRAHAR